MKRFSLRARLALIVSALLMICCLIITFSVMNSAVIKLDSIEEASFHLSGENMDEIEVRLNVQDMYPELAEMVGQIKKDFLFQSVLVTFIVMILGVVSTWFLSKYALQPIITLSKQIEETTENNLYQPLEEPEVKDEVAMLTRAFNGMRSRLNQAFLMQKQFSANAAHELRTPLAIMQTSLEVFQKKEQKTQEEYASAMDTTLGQVERMNKLVNTLLEFQSMHTAELTDQVCPAELVEEILCDLESLAEEKGITLVDETKDAGRDLSLMGNEVLIYRAIYNLIDNSIKYNQKDGSVKVEVKQEEDMIQILVSDTGKGIPKEQWEMIFDAFYRVNKSRSRASGGAGLGLAMVKEIALLHKGSVFVKDSSSFGTTICLSLPQ